MFIKTKQQKANWEYFRLFDTDTGMQYTLLYRPSFKESDTASSYSHKGPCYLDIDSVVATQSESMTSGLRYEGREAIDFWLQLTQMTQVKISEWIIKAGNTVSGFLDSIRYELELAS